MRVAAKLIFLFVGAAVLLIGIEAYLSIDSAVTMFDRDMHRDTERVGRTLQGLVEDVWRTSGEQRALQIIGDANEDNGPLSVRWVWLDAPPGDPQEPKVSSSQLQSVRQGHEAIAQERDAAGRGIRYTYLPLKVAGPRRGALELANSLIGVDQFRRNAILRATVVGIALLVASVCIAVVLGVTVIGRPLDQLIEKTRRVGAGDLSGPLAISGRDELSELAHAFNQMCDRLAAGREQLRAETEARISALQQLRHADRLTLVGRLAAGMAHELGTPMNVVSARAELIAAEAPSELAGSSARIIKAQIERMTVILRQLLDFARRRTPQKQRTDLSQLADQSVELLTSLARRRNVEIEMTANVRPALVEADASQIQQVLTNLIDNAVQAMPQGGTIRVTIENDWCRPPGTAGPPRAAFARLDVRDEGVGIPRENLEQIFEPFFTTKKSGEGTGLGLSIVADIVREHGGWMTVDSAIGGGSCFSVYLPLVTEGAPPPSEGLPRESLVSEPSENTAAYHS